MIALAFEKAAGVRFNHVPHKGGGPTVVATVGAHVDACNLSPPEGVPQMAAGQLRCIAAFSEGRMKDFPDVPTAKEQGINVTYLMWRGILAPKDTPRPIIEKLAAGFKQMTEDKSVKRMINKFGDDLHYLGPDEFTKLWREEYESHKELGKQFKK